MEIKSKNTNTLMPLVYRMLASEVYSLEQSSRNGPVRRFKEPVAIRLTRPWERVNFSPTRDANPFFHLMEALAMFAAFNNVKFMCYFAKTMAAFSDDGKSYNAFYGTRMRRYDLISIDADHTDQLKIVIDTLASDPTSRQALVDLWDPADLSKKTKDKACNLNLLFDVKEGELCMTSFNRSNDAILGSISGANTVHLSMFQEYVACALNLPMGPWWHVSNNLHVYVNFPKWEPLRDEALFRGDDQTGLDPYDDISTTFPLFGAGGQDQFEHDNTVFLSKAYQLMDDFVNCPSIDYVFKCPFIEAVAKPMFNVWQAHKRKTNNLALQMCGNIAAEDWKLACTLWLYRRTKTNNPTNSTPPVHVER